MKVQNSFGNLSRKHRVAFHVKKKRKNLPLFRFLKLGFDPPKNLVPVLKKTFKIFSKSSLTPRFSPFPRKTALPGGLVCPVYISSLNAHIVPNIYNHYRYTELIIPIITNNIL